MLTCFKNMSELDEIEKAIELNDAGAYNNRGIVYYKLENYI